MLKTSFLFSLSLKKTRLGIFVKKIDEKIKTKKTNEHFERQQ